MLTQVKGPRFHVLASGEAGPKVTVSFPRLNEDLAHHPATRQNKEIIEIITPEVVSGESGITC
jgi:hypothetical protein